MKINKKILRLSTLILTMTVLTPQSVQAFQPASHYALIRKVSENLDSGSTIKKALDKYPDIAAWGAAGPDLGYLQPSELGGYAPWADRYHYYKVGSFAKTQLKDALNSGDYKKIAFAAGWVSHVSGDLACHGIFVNPECGVYLDNESTRGLHKELESNAEAYVWSDLGGLSRDTYANKKLEDVFSSVDSIPFSLMNNTSSKVYDNSPSQSEESQWSKVLLAGFETGIGYSYKNYDDAMNFLSKNGRKNRLDKAFATAKSQCTQLLQSAEKGDYSKFSDRWNLDVGESESPISSLTAIIKTGTKSGAGTDDDIYFGIELKNGSEKQWKLDKDFYNDFENGDKDEYYLYINDVDFAPASVKRIWVEKKHINYSLGEAWYLENVTVDVNGQTALDTDVNKWVKKDNSVYLDVDWSNIKNTTDPKF